MHLATFIWNDAVSDEQVRLLDAELDRLPALIPQLRGYQHGRDLGLRPGNGDYGVCALLDSAEDLRAYLDHPEHQRVGRELISPMSRQRLAAQIWVTDDVVAARTRA